MKPQVKATPFFLNLRFQLSMAIIILLGVLAMSAVFSFHSEQQRRDDHAALEVSGSIDQLIQALIRRSELYAAAAPRDWETYYRDLGMYGQELKNILSDLNQRLPRIDHLPSSLMERWLSISEEITQVAGDPAEPRLEAVANWVISEKKNLLQLSTDISQQTRDQLNSALEQQRSINIFLLSLSTIVGILSILILRQFFSKPLHKILQKLQLLSQGEQSTATPLETNNEMGQIYTAIDDLAQNLNTTFTLTQRVNQATSIDSALCFVYEQYKQLLPVDAVCLIRVSDDENTLQLERVHTDQELALSEQLCFDRKQCSLSNKVANSEFTLLQQNTDWEKNCSELSEYLHQAGLRSALFFPFSNSDIMLLFASQQAQAFSPEHLQLLQNAGGQLQHAFEKTELVESLVISAISGLSKLAESRDPETGDHLDRMSRYSMILAEELRRTGPYQTQIDASFVRDILRFAPMHDIGKVGVPDHILLKPGRLDPEERSEMEKHPSVGGDVLQRCEEQLNARGHSMFRMGIEIAQSHHEKWNGKGYPNGLTGEEIPLSARIVAVADVFDALTSKRPYKDAWPVEKALSLFEEESGEHFDPEVVAAFNRALPEIMQVYNLLKHV